MKWNETIMSLNIATNPITALVGEELAELIVETLDIAVRDGFESSFDVSDVEHNHVSGFVPFTSGGFTAVGAYSFDSETAWNLARIRPMSECDETAKAEAFREEFPDAVKGSEYEHAEYEAFDMEWRGDDDSTFFTRADAAMWSPGVITFRFGVCNDVNYGRDFVGAWAGDCGTAWYYECAVHAEALNADMVEMIGDEMTQAWSVACKVAGRAGELSEYVMPATVEEARDQAIAYSNRVARVQSMSDVRRDGEHFDAVVEAFPELRDEFAENGII